MNYINLNSVDLYLPVGGQSFKALFSKQRPAPQNARIRRAQGGHACVALDNITFEIKAGERIGLVGHNGAGKSSLLRILAGIYCPSRGSIEAQGRISTLFAATIGMNDNLSGRENIFLSARTLGMSRTQIARANDDIIAFSDLGDFIEMPLRTYSDGMRMRLGFAIATAIEPEILLIDEVIGTGDTRFKTRARERLSSLIDRTGIIVLASHSESIIRDFCKRVIWLEHGKIKLDGDTDTVLRAFQKSQVQKKNSNVTL